MKEIAELLSRGLLAGYAGKEGGVKREIVQRGGIFPFKTSHLERNGEIYHDEWVGQTSGGGQEIVQTKDGRRFTRIYGGGVAKKDILDELGLTPEEVLGRHKRFLKDIGNKSRFDQDIEPQRDKEWEYEYTVVEDLRGDGSDNFGFDEFSDVNLTTGIERISFDGQIVFAHVFILIPVE